MSYLSFNSPPIDIPGDLSLGVETVGFFNVFFVDAGSVFCKGIDDSDL